ncbi:MAG: UDP-2,3-diacylglucosamine diphosphatase [Candidatus Marinimicrobia bacterium]|nr:UDP-2,3-diacylglucosamine diphosphatase [Candidatus Neomarinimicrobiota bacterium]
METSDAEQIRREKLFSLFDKIESTQGTLIIGGDFFDFWFDYKYVVPKGFNDILYRLEHLYKSGIKIHYILGNHDYWDFGSFTQKFGAIVHDGDLEFDINGQKILVTHGDGLLKNDVGYRFMKRVIRSKLSIILFKLFHPDWGCALARKVSNTSSHYHHHDKKSIEIRNEMRQFANKKWNEGYDVILIGHYHQTEIETSEEKSLIFMGDWLKHFTVTIVDENGWQQNKWN